MPNHTPTVHDLQIAFLHHVVQTTDVDELRTSIWDSKNLGPSENVLNLTPCWGLDHQISVKEILQLIHNSVRFYWK